MTGILIYSLLTTLLFVVILGIALYLTWPRFDKDTCRFAEGEQDEV